MKNLGSLITEHDIYLGLPVFQTRIEPNGKSLNNIF